MSTGPGRQYAWLELGATGTRSTNVQRQGAAGTIPFIPAQGAGKGIYIYQIDWDISEPLCSVIVGDGTAVENGTNRIAFNRKGISSGTVQYPNGFICRSNQAVQALITDGGDGVDCWIRITYTTD
jgi:hypothetical protein